MRGKLFIQIILLMIVFIVLVVGIKCLVTAYYPIKSKSTCNMCAEKMAENCLGGSRSLIMWVCGNAQLPTYPHELLLLFFLI